jgi:hypothetical protein
MLKRVQLFHDFNNTILHITQISVITFFIPSNNFEHLSDDTLIALFPKYDLKKSAKVGTLVETTWSYGFLPGKGGLNNTEVFNANLFKSGC